MKVRDSGMPEEEVWKGFFDPEEVLDRLGLGNSVPLDGRARTDPSGDWVEFGCGYGIFTAAAAGRTSGTVHALDIEPDMAASTRRRAESLGLSNIRVTLRDFVSSGTGLPDASAACCLLFNILHAEHPVSLLQEAFRVLKPGGTCGVIHWIHDASTPRGPDLSIRPKPEQCRKWLEEAGFACRGPVVDLPPYHFGLTGIKPG